MGSGELPHARVFLSCGQNKNSDEVATATAIERRLRELSFDPYIAVQEQTLRGLKENIFNQLSKSEYFIFIDFRREKLGSIRPPLYRGSLFSHQELALASYLNIPVLALQESGVKRDDGILGFLQANAITFADRHLLANVVADEVQKRGWNPHWRNELILEREGTQFSDAYHMGVNKHGRFFHISVRNRHRHKTATNCYVSLERAINLSTLKEIPLNAVVLKWAGYTLPNAYIPPGTARRFDAFWISRDLPTQLQFQGFTDSTEFMPNIGGKGSYKLEYLVTADNFPTIHGSFILNLDSSLHLTTLESERAPPPDEVGDSDPLYQAALAVEQDETLAAEMAEWELATIKDGLSSEPSQDTTW
jgi:hypothetical protein